MKEYIDKEKLYNLIAEKEEIARQRYLDTPWDSPAKTRYQSQLNERSELKHLIFDMQAEDVAPVVHGKWEFKGKDKISDVYICSNCNIIIGLQLKTKYCPNCGAKMDLED